MNEVKNKVLMWTLITGASSGIGAALASDPAMNNRAKTIAARRMPLTTADVGQSI